MMFKVSRCSGSVSSLQLSLLVSESNSNPVLRGQGVNSFRNVGYIHYLIGVMHVIFTTHNS